VYRASDELAHEAWLADVDEAADRLGLGDRIRSRAADLFLSSVDADAPDRSKRATLAAALYVAALAEGDRRSQGAVADAVGVARLTVQQRWKDLTEEAGLVAPDW
jgi:transcription initiation factor TFIIIB Brf1 subunit/transcription initiation factor TFIIB